MTADLNSDLFREVLITSITENVIGAAEAKVKELRRTLENRS